jgi:hypothetical protein
MNEPLRRPFKMSAVRHRHVLDDGGVAAYVIVASMTGNAAARCSSSTAPAVMRASSLSPTSACGTL